MGSRNCSHSDRWSRGLQYKSAIGDLYTLVGSFRIDCQSSRQRLAQQLAFERCQLPIATAKLACRAAHEIGVGRFNA